MTIPILSTVIRVLWVVIEQLHLRRHSARPARDWDKHSAKLWDAAHLCELAGMVLGFLSIGHFRTDSPVPALVGVCLLVAGITIRWSAIHTLGKYFTGVVMIRDDHTIIRNGPYRYVRHPAYTGSLLGHLGLGLSFSNWFSLPLSTIPYLAAAFYRMRVEERALRDSFGEEYLEYAARTRRLIPKIY